MIGIRTPEHASWQPPRWRLGMLTPSSNTVLEPTVMDMLQGVAALSVHFARFRVTQVGLSPAARTQFDLQPMLEAAGQLADARCHSICWSGTSAAWLGLDADRKLCRAIEAATGVPANSVLLALDEMFRMRGLRRFALVTPYTADVVAAIVGNFATEGYECVAERHASLEVNYDFAGLRPDAVAAMIREVAEAGPQAIVILCTNMRGARIAAGLELELGIPVYDSIAVGLRAAIQAAGAALPLQAWGAPFAD